MYVNTGDIIRLRNGEVYLVGERKEGDARFVHTDGWFIGNAYILYRLHVDLQNAGACPTEHEPDSGGRTLSGFSKENPETSAGPFRARGLKIDDNTTFPTILIRNDENIGATNITTLAQSHIIDERIAPGIFFPESKTKK